jgi:hypothetical protein
LATLMAISLVASSPVPLPRSPITSAVAPDFSRTVVTTSPQTPLEGDLVTFVMTARNSGPDPAEPAWIVLTWPAGGYFVAVRGLDAPQIDPEQRRIEAYIPLAAGAERRIEVDVLSTRDSAGHNLTLGLRVSHPFSGTDHYDSHRVMVDTRAATGGISLGGFRFTAAGIGVLVWIAAIPLVWLLVSASSRGRHGARRWRENPAAATLMLMLPIGFWSIFAGMAVRDRRAATVWRQADCTVVGTRMTQDTAAPTTTTVNGSPRRTSSAVYSPELAMRYTVDDRVIYSSGYDTGSMLRIGGRARRDEELRRWTIGSTIPCWYDPSDIRDVVVHRGFGGAYLFALIPLPLFLLGVSALRRRGSP